MSHRPLSARLAVGLTLLGAAALAPAAVSAPAAPTTVGAVSWDADRIDLFTLGLQKQVEHRWYS
ncbi:hypothetical protein ACFVVU_02230 [Kitasatospora sp. NPDC057965]|uniref:hypothetical protein n=1 Tax=Kitasatospora sp. NPDC057965 TaxID=3346291 RepID=UPI0036D7C501